MQKQLGDNIIDEDDQNMLIKLLSSKGINLTKAELTKLLDYERQKQDYMSFRSKVLYNNPKTDDEFILNYINICNDSNYNRRFLFRLLSEEGFSIEEKEELCDKIARDKERIRLAMLEERLSGSSEESK